jgi:carbamoyl-phosphate synthase small subunit
MSAQKSYNQKTVISQMNEVAGYLMLIDGTVFKGLSSGKIGKSFGEICLFTGMTGYQEAFTDPSYTNQIILMSNAHIGNYGYKKEDHENSEGSVQVSGVVCRNYSTKFSRSAANGVQELLKDTVVIYDIDTRAVVRHLRQYGNMNAIIVNDGTSPEEALVELKKQPKMEGLNLSESLKTSSSNITKNGSKHRVGVFDFGCKKNILQELVNRGCDLEIYDANSLPKSFDLDGYLISNGPGDPASMTEAIRAVKNVVDSGKPVFGICLGHQLLALSQGLKTYKMKNGHRGGNHAVLNVKSGKAEVTSQNHGFAVEDFSRPDIEVTHINLNDKTVEGIKLKNRSVFSVQHHPEACSGPHDSAYLFDQFINLIELEKHEQRSEI